MADLKSGSCTAFRVASCSANEFNAWWDADARRLAAVIKRIGKIEVK